MRWIEREMENDRNGERESEMNGLMESEERDRGMEREMNEERWTVR